jgi:hypothetical protein
MAMRYDAAHRERLVAVSIEGSRSEIGRTGFFSFNFSFHQTHFRNRKKGSLIIHHGYARGSDGTVEEPASSRVVFISAGRILYLAGSCASWHERRRLNMNSFAAIRQCAENTKASKSRNFRPSRTDLYAWVTVTDASSSNSFRQDAN